MSMTGFYMEYKRQDAPLSLYAMVVQVNQRKTWGEHCGSLIDFNFRLRNGT